MVKRVDVCGLPLGLVLLRPVLAAMVLGDPPHWPVAWINWGELKRLPWARLITTQLVNSVSFGSAHQNYSK